MAPRVRVVVLNFNGGDLTRACVASLARLDWPADALDVVVVDNASSDDSLARALAARPGARAVALADNRGFPANNVALADLSGVDYVALCNNDTEVEPGWLAPLVAALEADPRAGAACPKILFAPGCEPAASRATGRPVVNNAGNEVLADGYGVDRGFGEPDDGRFDQAGEVFAWCGASVLLRPAYLADAGLLDERFFLYYEDTDLAWRGRRRGWRYRYVPESVVWHRHSATTGSGSDLHVRLSERNRLCMLVKNAPAQLAITAFARFPLSTLSYARHEVLAPLVRGRRPSLRLVRLRTQAYVGALALVPAMWRERRRLARRAIVPAGEVAAGLRPR